MTEAVLLVGGQGTRLRPLTINDPQADAARRRRPVHRAPDRAGARGRGHPRRARDVVQAPRCSATTSATARASASSSSTPPRTSRSAPAARSATWPAVPRERPGRPGPHLQRRRADRARHRRTCAALHATTSGDVTLYLTRVDDPRAYGLVPTDADGRVTAFLEKPTTEAEIVTDQINAGCYVFRRSLIDAIPTGRPVSVEREIFPGLLASGARLSPASSTTATGSTSAPRWTSCKGSADLVRGIAPVPGGPGRTRATSSCCPAPRCRARRRWAAARSSAPGPPSARAPRSTARCSSTARWSPPGRVVRDTVDRRRGDRRRGGLPRRRRRRRPRGDRARQRADPRCAGVARRRARRDRGPLLLRPLAPAQAPGPAYQPRWSVMVARGPRRGGVCPLCSCRSRTARARCPAHGVSSSAIWSSSPSVRPVSACTIARARWKSPKDTASRSPQARTPTWAAVHTPIPGSERRAVPGLVAGRARTAAPGQSARPAAVVIVRARPGSTPARCQAQLGIRAQPGPSGATTRRGTAGRRARRPPDPVAGARTRPDPGPAHRTP